MRDWDPKSQPSDDENDDDLNWDWLSDAEQKETGSSERTGVTGQLSWQGSQTDSTDDEEEPGDKASFDWQTRKPGQGPQSSETGLTGNLDWQKNRFSGIPLGSETGLTGNLDWQEGAFTQHPDTVPETPAPAAPDASWDEDLGAEDSENDTLYGWPEGAEIPAPPSTGETDQLLDWMANAGDSADASAVDETPDWMLGLDEEASPSLRPAPSGPIASIDDTPDWMLDLDQADSEPVADETPDWMLGLDEPTPAASSQSSGDVDLPPWLADMDTDSTPEEDAAAPIADLESAYEWSPYDEQGTEEPVAEDNFFDTFESDTDDDLSFDGTFGVDDEEPVSEASGLDDFDFESLVGEQATQDDYGSDELDFDSLFAEANVEDEPAAPAPIPAPDSLNLDDMFAGEGEITDDAWLNEFEPDEQPVADEEMDFSSFFPEDDDEAEPNYMADIVASGRGNQDEWFNEPDTVTDDDPNWLDSLEDISLDDVIDTPPAAAKPAPATPSRPTPSPKPPEVDLDAMFADTDTSMPAPMGRGNTFDLNAFADIPDDDSIPAFATQDNPDVPDWLREAAASTDDQLSAAGIIRQKFTDRPIESLDDRLKALREAGLNLSSAPEEAPERRRVLEAVLPGVEDALAPGAAIGGTAAALDSALRVTPDQLKNAALLRSLVGHSSAAELDKAKARRPSRTAPPIVRVVIMAILLVAVLVPFFVTLNLDIIEKPSAEFDAGSPGANAFVRIATLPAGARVLVAAEYGPTGAAELDPLLKALLTHILSKSAQPILVSTNPVGMRHAQNIMIDLAGEGTNGRAYYVLGYQPGALLGLRNLDANASTLFSTDVQGEKTGLNIDSLDDVALAVIVAENAESVQSWVEQTRIGRQVPVLLASSVAAAPLILPYAQQGQVAGALTGYRDAVTYTHMLTGLGDLSMTLPDLPTQVILPTALPVTPTDIPPTAVPTQEITVEPTAEATQAILVEPTEISVTATPEETATPTEISVTATPEEPTATQTEAPTATPTQDEVTAAPTATTGTGLVITPPSAGNMVEVAIVIAQSNVNTRSGPGTEFDIVRALAPGAQVRVVDYNEDRSWVQVELADGEQAWIAEFLVAIREVPASEAGPMTPQPPRRSQRKRQRQHDSGVTVAQNETPAFDPTMLTIDPALMLTAQAAQDFALTQAAGAGIALTAGVVPSLDPSLAQTQSVVLTQAAVDLNVTVPTISSDLATTLTPGASLDGRTIPLSALDLPNTNERWNATTFGLVAAIVIIILGNVVAGLRALAGRRR